MKNDVSKKKLSVFATVGTTHYPFSRLTSCIIDTFSHTKNTTVIIQSGHTKITQPIPGHISIQTFLSKNDMENAFNKADIIISACGEGTVFNLINIHKKKKIFFPRNPKYAEHIDNQQLLIAKEIKKQKLGTVAFSTTKLKQLLASTSPFQADTKRINQKKKIIQLLNSL